MASLRFALSSILTLVIGLAVPLAAGPVPCGGGTLDFTATSDTPFTLPTFNVGQQTTLTAVTTGFTATSFSWTIPPPRIKDYNEDLGTQVATSATPAPLPWSTTALSAADLAASTVRFYWKPSAAQTHPLTGGPEARTVVLTVTPSGGGTCTSSTTFQIERNLTNPDKQPEDFFTSTHRPVTTTNTGFGHVVDEHIFWHQSGIGGGAAPAGSWLRFLAWHGYFLRRFDEWRAEFGYGPVAPWYPGRPLPTGPEFDHPAGLRIPFNPASNRIPTFYTIAGGTASDGGRTKLEDYASLVAFSSSFESGYHGTVHCNIGADNGGNFFQTSGASFGSMCFASSPKDPMFYRWHGFIDTLYRNYCRTKGLTCHSGPDPLSDPWMGDNAADIAANGTPPSSHPLWLSPDIWNRRAEITTDPCVPRIPAPNVISVGGVVRDCGSSADHENPLAGTPNFLYATLRNNRPGSARNVYAEVAVYIANASTGLAWPANFTMLPESRQFITVHLEAGQETDIGPLPWTPPTPTPSDHWCIYIRLLSVQETAVAEGTNISTNVSTSNSRSWRNLKIVEPGDEDAASMFIVRNINGAQERLALRIQTTPKLFGNTEIRLRLDDKLLGAFREGQGKFEGARLVGNELLVTAPDARIDGIVLPAGGEGAAVLRLGATGAEGDVHVTQISSKGIDGGVTLRVARRGTPGAANGFEGISTGTVTTVSPGLGRGWLLGVQSGMTWPLGSFRREYEPSTMFALQLERTIAPQWRIALQAGDHEFDERLEGAANAGVVNVSLLARFTGSAPSVRPFLIAGPGAYRAFGSWHAGLQVGAGLEVPLTANVSLTTQATLHRVNGGTPKPQWAEASIGFLCRIP
jgi:hypothetical protein